MLIIKFNVSNFLQVFCTYTLAAFQNINYCFTHYFDQNIIQSWFVCAYSFNDYTVLLRVFNPVSTKGVRDAKTEIEQMKKKMARPQKTWDFA